MALPKRKHSTNRKGKRRASIKLKRLNLVTCPVCNQLKKTHQVCPSCNQNQDSNRKKGKK